MAPIGTARAIRDGDPPSIDPFAALPEDPGGEREDSTEQPARTPGDGEARDAEDVTLIRVPRNAEPDAEPDAGPNAEADAEDDGDDAPSDAAEKG